MYALRNTLLYKVKYVTLSLACYLPNSMAARKREAKLRSQKHNYTLTEVVCSPEMLFRYLPPATLKIDHPMNVMVILTGLEGG